MHVHVSSANPLNPGRELLLDTSIASNLPARLKLSKSIPKLVCMLNLDVQEQLCSRDHPMEMSPSVQAFVPDDHVNSLLAVQEEKQHVKWQAPWPGGINQLS